MRRFWQWLTVKEYECACGKAYRNEDALTRHVRRHERGLPKNWWAER